MLTSLTVVELGGQEIAIQAAKNFRALRRLGVTVRKTIDTVIATRCIESGYDLLHNDLRRSRELTHPCLPKMTQAF
jgi:predicted nucleic acid-binding protein